jgi:hypothetical protein
MSADEGRTGGYNHRKTALGTTAKGQTAKDLVRNAKHSRPFGRM